MTIDNVPEGGWPSIEILAPYETPDAPEVEVSVLDLTDDEAVEELLQFYKDSLVPQMACAPDGSTSPYPQKGWLLSVQQPKLVVVARCDGALCGVCIYKAGQIFYPFADPRYVASIFRAMWAEGIKHFDYVWGKTENPVLLECIEKAQRIPRTPDCPVVNGDRVEWRRS